MAWHEIVKYSPKNYDENGVYTIDEWTSRCDVGKSYQGKIFTLDDYLKVEQQYIDVILSIMSVVGCKYLTIKYLEANKKAVAEEIESSKYKNTDSRLLKSLPLLEEKRRIHYKKISDIVRLCLREYLYVELSNQEHKLSIEFGYDYYLNVSCSLSNTVLHDIVKQTGLCLDPRG